jgi:hypothetical protein
LRFEANWGKKVHKTLCQKNLLQKRTGGVTQGIGPSSNIQHRKKKKKKKKRAVTSGERERTDFRGFWRSYCSGY